jgi:hypothetical protein
MAIIDKIYEQINEVIGGNDENQIFTMMLPGTLLNPADFSVGSKTDIELRSSRLANALLDVCEVAAGHNGRSLPDQFRSALANLLPQLNPKVEKMRRTLRDRLKQPIEVTPPNSTTKSSMAILDWFYLLVAEYNKAVAAWADAQTAQRQALLKTYPNAGDAVTREDAFNMWFRDNYAAADSRIAEAQSRVMTVFSADEKGLIDTLLGGGHNEIAQALRTLDEARSTYPHGEAYPVLFSPSDWPSLLTSDFGYVDLLKSPEAIALRINNAQNVIDQAMANLNALSVDIPTNLQDDLAKLTAAQQDYQSSQNDLLNTYTDNAATAAKIYLSKHNTDPAGSTADPSAPKTPDQIKKEQVRADDINSLTADLEKGNPTDPKAATKKGSALSPDDVNKLADGQKTLIQKQSNVQTTGLAMAGAAIKYIGDEAKYANLKPYYDRLAKATKDIARLQKELQLSARTSPNTLKQIFPNTASERFSQVQIDFKSQDLLDSSKLTTSFEQTDWKVDLFFGSASGTKSEAHSKFTHDVVSSSEDISIGFLVAKVEIDRPWFEPGIFARTGAMRSIDNSRISAGPLKSADFKSADEMVLPAFPTAFVIAKDITIQLTLQASQTNQVREVLDKHESQSGGLLCFSVSHVSAQNEDSKSFSSHVQSSSVIIRIASPQIIGWYQEFVPPDTSKPIGDSDDDFAAFLTAYKSVPASDPARITG